MSRPTADTDETTIILPDDGDYFDFGGSGGEQWKIDGPDTGERFGLRESSSG